jgi:hypothetical protein
MLSDPGQVLIALGCFADSRIHLVGYKMNGMTVTVLYLQLLFCFPLFNCQGAIRSRSCPLQSRPFSDKHSRPVTQFSLERQEVSSLLISREKPKRFAYQKQFARHNWRQGYYAIGFRGCQVV